MANKYCQKHKERLQKEASETNLSEEEKDKKRQYHREHNKNFSEEQNEKKLSI